MVRSNDAARANGKRPQVAAAGRAGLAVHAVAICLLTYLASVYLVDVTAVLLQRAGMARTDAVMAASMAGFLYLWLALMWAFSYRSIARAWLHLGGLTAAAALAAWTTGSMG